MGGERHTAANTSAKDGGNGRLYAIDVFSAIASAAPCAALVCMIDQAVTQNASKTATIGQSIKQNFVKMFTQPKTFFGGKAYLAVAVVYSGTYITANSIMTWTEKRESDHKNDAYIKLAGTSAVNIGLGVTKDSMFAVWFGKGSAASALAFPATSWGLFIFRDVLTVGAGFIFPQMVSNALVKNGVIKSQATSDIVSQLTVPMAFQTVLTPIHLMALDVYNRPGKPVNDRVNYISSIFKESFAVRIARVGVVYGIAGVGNKFIRKGLREATE